MKVAKNMDSVFDNCTQDELDFEAFFDNDDCLIDIVAGLDEAGNLLTGEYEDIDKYIAMGEAEESQGVPLTIGGEVGDGKEVSGKEDSAESKADDVKDEEEAIGANDNQQTSLESADPLEDDDEKERAGEVPADTVATESADEVCPKCNKVPCECEDPITGYAKKVGAVVTKESSEDMLDRLADSIMESVFSKAIVNEDAPEVTGEKPAKPVKEEAECCPDTAAREGEVEDEKRTEPMGAAASSDSKEDVIEDKDDDKMREGSEKRDSDNVEGVDTKAVAEPEKDDIIDIELEADECLEDDCEREGDVKHPTDNVEGKDAEPIGAATDGINNTDVIEDKDDEKMRDGSEARPTDNVEGVKSKIVEAIMNKLDGLDIELEEEVDITLDPEDDTETVKVDGTDDVVPDDVNTSAAANEIKPDRDTVYESIAEKIALVIGESSEEDAVDADEDDELIEIVQKSDKDDDEIDLDLDYSYDDEELIDMVVSGKVDDIDIEDVE